MNSLQTSHLTGILSSLNQQRCSYSILLAHTNSIITPAKVNTAQQQQSRRAHSMRCRWFQPEPGDHRPLLAQHHRQSHPHPFQT